MSENIFPSQNAVKWLVVNAASKGDQIFPYGTVGPESSNIYTKLAANVNAIGSPKYSSRLRSADLDNNGSIDLIIGSYGPIEGLNTRLRVLLNIGQQLVDSESIAAMNIDGHVEQVLVADFNNDQLLDLFIPSYEGFYLLENKGGGEFVDQSASSYIVRDRMTFPKPEGAEAIDINLDGMVDIVVGTRIYLNTGNFQFNEVSENVGLPILFDEGIKVADLDNDGDFDLIVHCLTGLKCPGFHIYENHNFQFKKRNVPALREFDGCQFLGVAVLDLDDDMLLDLVFGANSQTPFCNRNMIFKNLGDLEFDHSSSDLNFDGVIQNAVPIDYNGDAIQDLLALVDGYMVVFQRKVDPEPSQIKRYKIMLEHEENPSAFLGSAVKIGLEDGSYALRHIEGGGYITQGPSYVLLSSAATPVITATLFGDVQYEINVEASGEYELGGNALLRADIR